jgi:F0F1-type ATP synthase beta subunit
MSTLAGKRPYQVGYQPRALASSTDALAQLQLKGKITSTQIC